VAVRAEHQWVVSRDEKGGGATAPSRGRRIFQQKNICDRISPSPPSTNYMTRIVDLRKKTQKNKPVISTERNATLTDSSEPKKEEVVVASVFEKPVETTKKIEWEAPSFYYNPQKKYLALVIIALLCGAGAILFYRMDTLTAIFLILSSLVLILYSNKKPTMSKIIVNHAGITIDDVAYYYKDLKSFWLDYDPHGPRELSLEAKKWYMPYIKVSIENQNPAGIRSLMINFVSEREHEKSLVDLISRKIGL